MNNEDLSLKLFVVLTRALSSIRKRAEEDIKELGLNPTEFAVLEFIYSKGEQSIQKIGQKVLIASSSITYVVDKLEKKQLIKRKPCPTDRRITFVALTDEGQAIMDELFPQHKESLTKIFEGLDREEKQVMIEQLKKLGYHAEKK
ncbi:MarR family transcriptional regulator [Gracilibacillus sp. S3-1-1]|uniref:MarR family transcriptional regulator n=1 Tax=Gracilibacillus pellucidus TaxID=3095368 RepID=A0ACC6M784_9BACI|nr:MarR family transcriptional regulator [Gracilibacillus sp. S3-1-1]MDX8046855.1 MarR family transcriptional regulator [Gracilibacillus sp. S3-1-1]